MSFGKSNTHATDDDFKSPVTKTDELLVTSELPTNHKDTDNKTEDCLENSKCQSDKSPDYPPMDGAMKLMSDKSSMESEQNSKGHEYETIDEDTLDTNPKQSTYPPPQIPMLDPPNRAKSTSSLKSVRIVDVANSYMDRSTPTTEENRQILLTGIRKNISIKEIETILKSDLLKRSDDLEEIKVDRVHGEAVVTLKNGRAASDVLDKAKR
ncbi:uncharacterized protein LOC132718709 [Ruditapes philippinarum]|uniref:uncharacterized protein LOC132718709 n=1 Tax=Ruditapes philippinarum TaxID=129788 RepID=UPI00295BA98C|nr:uncharacterized protein LOC132718709 [Ruditapes philippinarum]